MKTYGNSWKKVEKYLPTRTSSQIRSHAQKFFIRLTKEFNCDNPGNFIIDHMYEAEYVSIFNKLEGKISLVYILTL